ncbi:Hypothetical protein NTJ_10690 [Nesidiocoris tenuis]|uniref:Uncharacterized protein n=1 Tax=Nesidiocoris tenuis TaxID=355587 RepID=A0ABN7B3Y5_9HEMI|nr:Hypothetical protein NTJ_10690 [Nesidiocoris tenuis]
MFLQRPSNVPQNVLLVLLAGYHVHKPINFLLGFEKGQKSFRARNGEAVCRSFGPSCGFGNFAVCSSWEDIKGTSADAFLVKRTYQSSVSTGGESDLPVSSVVPISSYFQLPELKPKFGVTVCGLDSPELSAIHQNLKLSHAVGENFLSRGHPSSKCPLQEKTWMLQYKINRARQKS